MPLGVTQTNTHTHTHTHAHANTQTMHTDLVDKSIFKKPRHNLKGIMT